MGGNQSTSNSKSGSKPTSKTNKSNETKKFKSKEGMDTITAGYPFDGNKMQFYDVTETSGKSYYTRRLNPNHGIYDQMDMRYSEWAKRNKRIPKEGFVPQVHYVSFRNSGCIITADGTYQCNMPTPVYTKYQLYPASATN